MLKGPMSESAELLMLRVCGMLPFLGQSVLLQYLLLYKSVATGF